MLQQQMYTVGEGSGPLTVCIELNGTTEKEVIINVSTEEGSAQGISTLSLRAYHSVYLSTLLTKLYTALPIVAASGDFFGISDRELTFQSAAVEQCTQIGIEDDTILENNETFSVQLSTLDPDVNLTLSTATVTIEDDDSELYNLSHYFTFCNFVFFYTDVTVGLQQSAYEINEELGPLEVCTVLSEVTERTVVVTLATIPRTAQGLLIFLHAWNETMFYKHNKSCFCSSW